MWWHLCLGTIPQGDLPEPRSGIFSVSGGIPFDFPRYSGSNFTVCCLLHFETVISSTFFGGGVNFDPTDSQSSFRSKSGVYL